MALIKTIQEIRAVLPRISNLSNTAMLPNLDKAAWKFIVPVIGQEQYDDLDQRYNGNGAVLSALELQLIKHIQLPLAAYALNDEMAFIHAVITDNGIRTTSTDKMQAAHRWEFNELRNALLENAMDGTEILLSFLFANEDSFPLWVNSDIYISQNSLLIKTSADFSKQYKLYQPQRTYFQLIALMADVEENYLISQIGRGVLNFIKSVPKFETTSSGSTLDVKALLKKAVAFITIASACEHLQVQFSTGGFTVLYNGGNTDDDTTGKLAANYNQMDTKKQAANRDGNNYLAKAAYYIQGMGTGDFPSDSVPGFQEYYIASPLYIDPTIERVWLTNGNDRRRIFIM